MHYAAPFILSSFMTANQLFQLLEVLRDMCPSSSQKLTSHYYLKMSPQALKPKLTKELLQDNGIFFSEDVCSSKDLPDEIRPIRELLICFGKRLPTTAKAKFEKELNAFKKSGQDSEEAFREFCSLEPLVFGKESVYVDRQMFGKDQFKCIQDEIAECEKNAKEAIELRIREEREPGWMHFLRNHLFKQFPLVRGVTDLNE